MYYLVDNYAGWLWDDEFDQFISPRGRIAEYPGGPLLGQISNEENNCASRMYLENPDKVTYDRSADTIEITPRRNAVNAADAEQIADDIIESTEPVETLEILQDDGSIILAETYVVGDITVNVVDIP